MLEYTVYYTTEEHDSCKVTVHANSIDEAKSTAKREYWDVQSIDQIILNQ